MTEQPGPWTRRAFSTALAMFAGMPYLGCKTLAETLSKDQKSTAGLAYIGSTAGVGAIHAFDTTGDQWRPVQTTIAAQPTHLERHPSLPILYAVHGVALWEHLPCGAVSAYYIEPASGCLRLLNTQPLSLSATSPCQATVILNGTRLIVAAQRGGSYDLLPIAADGSLLPTESARKEIGLVDGRTTKTAQPRYVLQHPDGSTLLTADSGNESIHSFVVEVGSLHRRDSLRVHEGAGPSQIALSRDGEWIYALNAVDGSLSVHRWNQDSKKISNPSQALAAPRPGPTLMAMHPTEYFLVTVGADSHMLAVSSWSIDHRSGNLALIKTVQQNEGNSALAFSPHGEYLIRVDAPSGRISRSSFDIKTGFIGRPHFISQVDSASCLSLHSV
jgi:6-phosphogluconolactonase